MVSKFPKDRVIPLPNSLNGLRPGVTDHLLTGMILQVVGWLVSRVHWGDFLVCFGGQEFLWQKIRKMFEVKIGRRACGLRSISTCSNKNKKSQMSDWFLVSPAPKQRKKPIN